MSLKQYDPKIFKSGACVGMPNAVYHSNPAISLSKIKVFLESPEIFEGQYLTGELERRESDALRRGSAQHVFTLEGEQTFAKEFAVLPELNWRSKADKLESACLLNSNLYEPLPESSIEPLASGKRDDILAFFSDQAGPSYVTNEEIETVRAVDAAIKAHPLAAALLAQGTAEVSFRSAVGKLGFAVQCRTDWLNEDGCTASDDEPYMLDLKTVASLDRWDKNFQDLGYWMQWPFYCKTMEAAFGQLVAQRGYFVVAETQWPYRVRVCQPDPEDWGYAMSEIERGFNGIARCLKTGIWKSPDWDKLQIQGLPGWARHRIEAQQALAAEKEPTLLGEDPLHNSES